MLTTIASGSQLELHPFGQDKPIRPDGDRWAYFFRLPRGVDLASDPVFELSYDTSPTLGDGRQVLTVMLNDQPVDAIPIEIASPDAIRRTVELPRRYCKGGFNELVVIARSKVTIGPCRDADDLQNWVRFSHTSVLRLDLTDQAVYPLGAYPFPYANWLTQPVSTFPIETQPRASDASLSAGINIAAGLGSLVSNQPVLVRMTRQRLQGVAIHVGLTQEAPDPQPQFPIEARTDGLWVSGANPGRLADAVRSLNDPLVAGQMSGFQSASLRNSAPADDSGPRIGTTTFEELGYPSIELSGLGAQGSRIVLRRPTAVKIGRGGQLTIRFRHSATLVPARSLISVAVNNQLVGSAVLKPDNANGGTLVCPLPISLADQNEWRIEITAHHDLANVDCSKSYTSIAWTTILGTSDFALQDGALPNLPFLEGFPYLRDRDGKLPETVIVNVGPKPSPEALTCAATIAARASQTNHGLLTWVATTGPINGSEDVILGLYGQERRFNGLADELSVAPAADREPKVRSDLPIMQSTMAGGVVVEAVPKAQGGVAYVVLGSTNKALEQFAEFLAKPDAGDLLQGQVAVLSASGETFTFQTMSEHDKRVAEAGEMRRYKPGMVVSMGCVLLGIAALATYVGSKFVKRKPRQPKPH